MPERKQLDASLVSRVAAGLRYALTGATPTEWFGPATPIQPAVTAENAEAAGVAGRQFDYRTGFNVDLRPRSGEAIGFPELRAFADAFDILRLVIETRKDQMCTSPWTIQPRDKAIKQDARCDKAMEFFRMPDREHGWEDWLRLVLEDLFVLDAPAIYIRRTNGGELYALEPIDGSTIKRVIDSTGRTPIDGPAYQQILKGVPAVNYTREELIYKPRNLRTHKVYGQGPVEQIVNTVNVGLRRQIMTTNYFTEGTVPDALAGVPESWSVTQIQEFQNYWDAMLGDDLAARRKLKFVPGEIAKNFHEVKAPPLKDMFDEWLARIVCYCFAIDVTPFVSQVNRSVAETNREQSLSEGRAPIEQWVKSLVDMVLVKQFGWADLEFVWQEGEIIDPLKRAQLHKIYVDAGILHPDEVRADMGKDPLTPEQKAEIKPPPPPQLAAPDDPDHSPDAGKKVGDKTDDKAEKVHGKKKALQLIDRERPLVLKAAAAIEAAAQGCFDAIRERVGNELAEALNLTVKAADGGIGGEEATVEMILAGLTMDGFDDLADELQAQLEIIYRDGAKQASKQLGIRLSTDAFNLANENAIEFAKQRAAEMVGMKWVDGKMIPNPNAQWRIDEGTREMLRVDVTSAMQDGWSNQKLASALKENYAFSGDRAKVIARTETARADVAGNLDGYRELGVKQKQWLTAPDCCLLCAELEGVIVGIDEEFPNGGGQGGNLHPNDRCDVLPVIED